MNLTKNQIDLLAVNADAAKNGQALARKKSFLKLNISADRTLLFGECSGSGKNPYVVSYDFIKEDEPVSRCSCPSRQLPCKHAVGLLYAYLDKQTFTEADIPEDVLTKREKLDKREEKKEEKIKEKVAASESGVKEPSKPSKAKINAIIKKIDAQLEGIEIADKIIKSIALSGIASIDSRQRKAYDERIKQLGSYYIDGIKNALYDIIQDTGKDEKHTSTINAMNYAYMLIKNGREYLKKKKEDPENNTETENPIEEQLGYAWKLDELSERGLCEMNTKLVQLSFYTYMDEVKKEFVDEGYWISLLSGKIFKTQNFRPFKALKYIKADDSNFNTLNISELLIYPGSMNPRARWNAQTFSETTVEDLQKIKGFAVTDYAELIKSIKNIIKNPLSDKNPVAIIKYESIKKSTGEKLYYTALDSKNNAITISDISLYTESIENVFEAMVTEKSGVMAVMFENNLDSALIKARPLSFVTDTKIVRLLY